MARVALVTDSTAYIPADLRARHDVRVVPVAVVVAGEPYDEGVEITPAQVVDALREYRPVTTSRPSPERFLAAYRAAAADGATAIVSAHLSADISGTYQSAVLASRQSPVPVEVVDSRSVGMGLGFAVLAGADLAAEGADAAQVAALVAKRAADSSMWFYVDTLEYLRRGGRIGAARALMGSALAIKPILTLADGRVAPFDRVRTAAKALGRLEDLAAERAAAAGPCGIAVHHLGAADRAGALAARLRERAPQADVVVSELGAVVGVHLGPMAVAVVVSPA